MLRSEAQLTTDSLPKHAGEWVYIDSIFVEGNRKTLRSLIQRELEFKVGDSIPLASLEKTLERNRLRVLNLTVFLTATFKVRDLSPDNHVTLQLTVREGWYIYPSPVFELVDRNINVWWNEFDHSLRRANIGGDFTHRNFTGRADMLSMSAVFGYNNRYALRYRNPVINKKQTLGLQIGINYSQQQEVAVRTIGNKLDFKKKTDGHMIRRFQTDIGLTWRPALYVTHGLVFEYHDNSVADSVASYYNYDFFLNGRTRQQHFSLMYTWNYDSRDVRPNPSKGWWANVEIRQNGLTPKDHLILARFKGELAKYTPIKPWLILETVGRLRLSLPRRKPPYYNNQGLGYFNDVVRGYEYYVSDGLDFGVIKTSVRFKWLDYNFPFPKIMEQISPRFFQPVPVKCYFSINNDLGYANDPYYATGNPLVNRPLYGYGIGLNVVVFHNTTFVFEYTRTDTGLAGFYVRSRL
jgi:outer membrane protein assembly factor BamA